MDIKELAKIFKALSNENRLELYFEIWLELLGLNLFKCNFELKSSVYS